jgi:hypothetical protein
MKAIMAGAALSVTTATTQPREDDRANYWLPYCKAPNTLENQFDVAMCTGMIHARASAVPSGGMYP